MLLPEMAAAHGNSSQIRAQRFWPIDNYHLLWYNME